MRTGSAGRLITAIATTVMLAASLSMAGQTAQASDPTGSDVGLFGSQDPTYDGVYRQSAAIMGLVAVNATVPRVSVAWLLRQQCADGSYAAYRPDPTLPCPAPDPANYTGPDTNSTAMAAMALRAVAARQPRDTPGIVKAAKRAEAWLARQQVPDGGWEWIEGLTADATSTGMSLASAGRAATPSHRRGAAWLRGLMGPEAACGLPFQSGGPVDPLSTSWGLIGAQGSLPFARHRGPRTITPCAATSPHLLATGSWLASAITAGNGQIPSAYSPDQTDWNSTALATLGLSQRHGSTAALRLGLAALQGNVAAYTRPGGTDVPGALGTLLMVAGATGADPRDFGGVDLIQRLMASLRR